MRNKILLLFMCMSFALSANAYAYNDYPNQPTTNQYTQNIFASYMEAVNTKLQKNWTAPDFLENAHTKVLFKLDNEGYVLSAKIVESSGNDLYDESAIIALQKSEPFGNFPKESTKQTLTINYSFDTSLVKTDTMREYLNKSNKYFYQGNNEQALEYIEKAIKEVQGEEKAYFLFEKRAKIKQALGNKSGANEDYAKFIELKKRVDIKRAHFVKHLAEVENTPFAYFYLAYCYEQIGEIDNAIKAIDKSISMTELNNQYQRYKIELQAKSIK